MTTFEMKREITSSKKRSKANKSVVVPTFYNDCYCKRRRTGISGGQLQRDDPCLTR